MAADLQASNFSLLNASDSQVFDSSASLSLPSEPPDIRNWFSSYIYESPELNAANEFEGCDDFRESDCGIEGFEIEEDKEENENLGKSRKFVTRDDLVVGGEKEGSDEFVDNNSSGGDNKYGIKDLDSADSISLSSEPPNVKNWFSSYVYESPMLDTGDGFRISDFEESESDRDDFIAGKGGKGIDEKLRKYRDKLVAGEKRASNGFVKCKNSVQDNKYDTQYVCKGNHGVSESKILTALNDLAFKRIPEEILENERIRNHVVGSNKNVEHVSLNSEESTEKLELKFSQEAGLRSSLIINNSSGNDGGKSPKKLHHRRRKDADMLPPRSYSDLISTNEDSMEKASSGSSAKENDENYNLEKGFVSTRKCRKVSDENSLRRPLAVQPDSLRNEDVAVRRRKVLSETTNFQHLDELEIAGKWKCPQKSKPNLGPPMKQLRLERWVHRTL